MVFKTSLEVNICDPITYLSHFLILPLELACFWEKLSVSPFGLVRQL